MVAFGVAASGLLVEMLWVGTSGQNKGGSVFNRSWTRECRKAWLQEQMQTQAEQVPRLPRFYSDIQTLTLFSELSPGQAFPTAAVEAWCRGSVVDVE